MIQPSDQSLLLRIQKGDEEALLVFHDRYASLVYSVAYRVLGEGPAAEEVTQDTFMQIWRKAQTYDDSKGSMVTWLVTIARRMAIDAYRKRERRPLSAAMLTEQQLELWENSARSRRWRRFAADPGGSDGAVTRRAASGA